MLVITILSRNNPVRTASPTKHGPEVSNEKLGMLVGVEMSGVLTFSVDCFYFKKKIAGFGKEGEGKSKQERKKKKSSRRCIPSMLVMGLVNDVTKRPRPRIRVTKDFFRVVSDAELHSRIIRQQPVVSAQLALGGVLGFVIDGMSGTRAGAAELIDTYPGEYLVIGPWVVVRPVVEFFVEPGKQANGRVVECVAYCAGFG